MAHKIWKWLSSISVLRSVCFDTNWSCHWRYEEEDPAVGSCHPPRAPWRQDASDGAAGLCRSYCESGQQNELVAAPLVLTILIFMICLHLPSLRFRGSLISTQIMFLNLGWGLVRFRTLRVTSSALAATQGRKEILETEWTSKGVAFSDLGPDSGSYSRMLSHAHVVAGLEANLRNL